ncbi:hypothetical protein EYF80_035413 [Liparis tanakae]|uniref:Uncharacterized protein n=1 Tax=Liparis tanakae TaxID=230148 RepID=A0A4Z2GMF8_9TELE|nr:hypothetical protein EYF80_035413 [Liparis tanakae]
MPGRTGILEESLRREHPHHRTTPLQIYRYPPSPTTVIVDCLHVSIFYSSGDWSFIRRWTEVVEEERKQHSGNIRRSFTAQRKSFEVVIVFPM